MLITISTAQKIWVFPKIGVPQNGWFIMENPIKMDDLGVPLFSETSICFSLFLYPPSNYPRGVVHAFFVDVQDSIRHS